ncbi:MAG TPA: pepsin/retropepsin-like aspartic protease family protein, partial [Longimicrobium sp.]|nr:pepsin/retropepsin-like aspartic protease family protein [Longimicrobium sp.]
RAGLTTLLLASAALAACTPPAPVANPAASVSPARLAELYERRDCFALRDALAGAPEGGPPALAFYRAAVDVAFNRPEQAIPELRRFIGAGGADAGLMARAHTLLADAYVRTYRYRDAADTYRLLAGGTASDSAGRGDAANVLGLWEGLRGAPAQTVAADGPVRLATTRDRANLVNVEAEANGQRIPFVYDTGANLSTVIETTAREMGMRMLDATVMVGTVTGGRTAARVAIAPELRLGDATVRNAAFLVFPDSALAFPQIGYQIRGIIGFPVIAAFGASTLARGGGIVLGDTVARDEGPANLCLDGLTPIIAVAIGGERLHFGMDTGAQSTDLYLAYFRAHRAELESGGAPDSVSFGGAGGMRRGLAYRLQPLDLRVGGRDVRVPSVRVFAERTSEASERLFGNLGQDVFGQFESMTLDFRTMHLRLR